MIPDFLAHRPLWQGVPVPWVVCWSDEMTVKPDFDVDDERGIVPNPGTDLEQWEGMYWMNTDRQAGIPDFASTNSRRQRDGMRHGMCQICGRPNADVFVIPDDGAIPSFINHRVMWEQNDVVINPPMHEACYSYSMTVCPHLQHTPALAVIRHAEPRCEIAHTTTLDGEQVGIPLDHPDRAWTLGRQIIVSLWRDGKRVTHDEP